MSELSFSLEALSDSQIEVSGNFSGCARVHAVGPDMRGQAGNWELVRVIQPGRSVQVKLYSTRTIKGRMDAWPADGMSVRQGKICLD